MIPVELDPGDPVAPYQQILRQVTTAISRGELSPGTKLPTVRALATELGVAANTVARAYRELEHVGLVETRGRLGTVVSGDGVDRAAKAAAVTYADAVLSLGIGQDDALDLVRRALDRPTSS